MAEPTSTTAIAFTASGLALFGIVTGLHPELMLAGLAGGWWALSYREPMPLPRRITSVVIASISAAWGAPVAMAILTSLSWWPAQSIAHDILKFPIAMMLGRLTHTVLGSSLDALVKRKLEGS